MLTAYATSGQLRDTAMAELTRARLSFLEGSATIQGVLAEPGQLVMISGSGRRFNGNAYVSKVQQEIKDGRWITTLGLGLPAFAEAQNEGTSPETGISGLYNGIVQDSSYDPEGGFRILIDIPAFQGGRPVWARYASPYASANAGISFFPEKNDEVLVGFFSNDPNSPVVLGSLYSKQRNAPGQGRSKMIVTPGGTRITLNDEQVVINTGNATFELGRDYSGISDNNGNRIQMDRNTMRISASGRLELMDRNGPWRPDQH